MSCRLLKTGPHTFTFGGGLNTKMCFLIHLDTSRCSAWRLPMLGELSFKALNSTGNSALITTAQMMNAKANHTARRARFGQIRTVHTNLFTWHVCSSPFAQIVRALTTLSSRLWDTVAP